MKEKRNLLDYFRNGPTDMVMNISVRDALRTRGDSARDVIMTELKQMVSRKVWTPVNASSMTPTERSSIIRSSMFLKEKHLPTGEFDKLKARLVAGGNQQDRELYEDLSAPTVSTSSVFSILAIAAHERRHTAVTDIGGAFLHADMTTGIDVYMRLDRVMTDMLVSAEKKYRPYVDDKGCLIVKLDKALYGCVESAALWYEHLANTLKSLGYETNEYDNCVFNRRSAEGVQCTVAIHVDDLLITCGDKEEITAVITSLREKYGDIKTVQGPVFNYLGMTMNMVTDGECRVTMKGYVDDLMESTGTTGKARSPARDDLFETPVSAEPSRETVRQEFHQRVAKLLYLAKRTRPDCLTAVSFLATRVQKCTQSDCDKLDRLMRYINSTRERGVAFRPGEKGITVSAYIDAAYGVHEEGRSHTGSCIVVGDVGAVHCKSTKQGLVTKSSTEAELVALSDSCNQGIHVRRFLIAQGHETGPLTVYQDNMSCLALMKRGRSAAEKTRHIDIRYFWMKERVTGGDAVMKHLGTEKMYANVLTKPLQGSQYVIERDMLTGWM